MIRQRKHGRALALAVMLMACTALFAQEGAKDNPSEKTPDHKQTVSKQTEKKPSLADVTRVNTAEAARDAAKDATKEKQKDQDSTKPPDGVADSPILEFQPATSDEHSAPSLQAADSKKGKNVHGEVYGSVDPKHPGTHQTGGAVGAGSKSGKVHVYLETEQSRSTLSPAQPSKQ